MNDLDPTTGVSNRKRRATSPPPKDFSLLVHRGEERLSHAAVAVAAAQACMAEGDVVFPKRLVLPPPELLFEKVVRLSGGRECGVESSESNDWGLFSFGHVLPRQSPVPGGGGGESKTLMADE